MKNKNMRKLAREIVRELIICIVIYSAILTALWYLFRTICSCFVWYIEDPSYWIIRTVGYNPFFIAGIWLIGFLIIFIIYLRKKLLPYIGAIVEASYILVEENEKWIKLPKPLFEIEQKMNQVKQEYLNNTKIAKESVQRKNDLVVYLAHDIKTPLTSMIGYLSLLDEIDDMPESQKRKYIKIALEKSFKLEDLINELFDITRFNSEKIVLEKEEINLNLMLEQIVDDFYPTLAELKKEISIKANEKILLNGDSDKLARVFNNVIKNAINYSKENSSITIEVTKENEYAVVVISNMGKQISEEKLSRIFEKFYRLDNSRTSKTGGSGLGLAIAKEIVKLHNGEIYATSNEMQTKFYIKLPTK